MAKQHIARHDKATSSARGNVVPFPLSRYAAKVRAVASQHGRALLVEGSTTEKCNALILWREINGTLVWPLRDAGIPGHIITRELDAFAQAVERELGRLAWMEACGLNPDDAA